MVPIAIAEGTYQRPEITFKPFYRIKYFGLELWVWILIAAIIGIYTVILMRR
jgi:hypothetical protein